MNIQAAFIDRDGTIGGSDQVEYPGDFKLFDGIKESLQLLKKAGISLYSFTNQPGISQGICTYDDFEKEILGFGFDKIYLCPHEHQEGCQCRKPSSFMLKKAAEENELDLKNCVVIGERWTDLLAADDAGCIKILVKTGGGMVAFNKYTKHEFVGRWGEVRPDYIAEDLNGAVKWLLDMR